MVQPLLFYHLCSMYRIPTNIFLVALLFLGQSLFSQIIKTDPGIPVAGSAVTITFDAALGNGGLKDFTGDVYAHTGVLTDLSTGGSDWKYVKTAWGENTPDTKLTRISANTYTLEIGPSIREYYGVPVWETITHMAFVFRSADSQLEGKEEGNKDIFVEVFPEGLKVNITVPDKNQILEKGSTLTLEATSSVDADLDLYLDDSLIRSIRSTELTHEFQFDQPGDFWVRVLASDGEDFSTDSLFIHVLEDQVTEPLPQGIRDGANYPDDSTAQLVLYAPNKEHAFVIGEFNNWTPGSASRMVVDGDRLWITLNDLEPGREYAYQYLVDGELTIADPYTEKILDPWNDKWITGDTYPDLRTYPSGHGSGITSVIQTARPSYSWNHRIYDLPAKESLVIYELLVRDFIGTHDWKTLTDTLDYLERLGINVVELMPVNEFEGNESWGYNPSFYFAPDKYYGPADDLKAFIDSCHARDMAVVIDMVLNHSYGQSPLVQLYFNETTGKVTSDNPWYNVDSPNPVFSWGYDFNHESQATRDFIDRVNRFWLEEYQVDGFRFDFTKGFTNLAGDGSAYDPARIEILKRMADRIWEVNDSALVILEHFAPNGEEKLLSDHGMLIWGNHNHNYNEATMGYHENDKSDFSWISYKERGWSKPHLVGYMESHDEERLMYKNLTFGNSGIYHDVQDLETALYRMELAGAFFFPIPGPKMIWQFGEVGYDYSIDFDCRVCNKPIRWDYYEDPARKQLYDTWSQLIRLKTGEAAFSSSDYFLDLAGEVKRIEIDHPEMDVRIVGNFGLVSSPASPNFSITGEWFDYFSGESFEVSDPSDRIILEPGEFHVLTTRKIPLDRVYREGPEFEFVSEDLVLYPNPVENHLKINPISLSSQIVVTRSDGRVALSVKLRPWQSEIDVSSLSEGLYVVTRETNDGDLEYGKIFKTGK